ncbi:MAG: radical SAM/SPASM domain-containing protein [Candidatus Paceibacterota bacterium]|jgi:MoaA/NifB/PqqE/SkfB family radical SAM enzyme
MSRLTTIQFEGSTFCNSRCAFCPLTDLARAKGTMSDELFHKIIKEGKEMGVKRFIPFLNGEPFANPKIFEWLDYMEKEGVRTCLFTNAELLDEEKIDRLAKYSNIDYINCSFNAATKETYDAIMRRPSFERAKKNVEYLIAKAPFKIKVGMTVVEKNKHETELFRKMWGRRAKFGDFVNWAGARHDPFEKTGERIPCAYILNKMYILWDGRACLCCFDYDGKVIFGDLNKESLRDVWEAGEPIRERHRKSDFDMALCRECNANAHKTNLANKK